MKKQGKGSKKLAPTQEIIIKLRQELKQANEYNSIV